MTCLFLAVIASANSFERNITTQANKIVSSEHAAQLARLDSLTADIKYLETMGEGDMPMPSSYDYPGYSERLRSYVESERMRANMARQSAQHAAAAVTTHCKNLDSALGGSGDKMKRFCKNPEFSHARWVYSSICSKYPGYTPKC
jgi:hypothetical protein